MNVDLSDWQDIKNSAPLNHRLINGVAEGTATQAVMRNRDKRAMKLHQKHEAKKRGNYPPLRFTLFQYKRHLCARHEVPLLIGGENCHCILFTHLEVRLARGS